MAGCSLDGCSLRTPVLSVCLSVWSERADGPSLAPLFYDDDDGDDGSDIDTRTDHPVTGPEHYRTYWACIATSLSPRTHLTAHLSMYRVSCWMMSVIDFVCMCTYIRSTNHHKPPQPHMYLLHTSEKPRDREREREEVPYGVLA